MTEVALPLQRAHTALGVLNGLVIPVLAFALALWNPALATTPGDFEVDFDQLLQLVEPSQRGHRGHGSLVTVQMRPDETVYSAATRICHSQNQLMQKQQAACVIPLAKWLQQRSAIDGQWLQSNGKAPQEPKPQSDVAETHDWLIRLPRDATRKLSAGISEEAPVLLETVSPIVPEESLYRFDKTSCPPLSNYSLQLLLHAGPFIDKRGVATRQGLSYFSDTDTAWAARIALHQRQLQRQLIAAAEYPSRLPANVFFQLHYEPTFSCTLEERIGPIMDGGKWICDPPALRRVGSQHAHAGSHQDRCLVYSVGSEKDTLFERAVVST